MKTADPVLLVHFTDFEDADQFKQKRTQCNYCTTTLARKNVSATRNPQLISLRVSAGRCATDGQQISIVVRPLLHGTDCPQLKRKQAHLINCEIFKQRHPAQWQQFCQYVQSLPAREHVALPPQTPQQQAQAQLLHHQFQSGAQSLPDGQHPLPSPQLPQPQQRAEPSSRHAFAWQRPHEVTSGRGYVVQAPLSDSNRIGWGIRPALMMLDVCTAYWNPESPLSTTTTDPAMSAVPAKLKSLLSTARSSRIPVLWTQMRFKRGLREAGLFASKMPLLSVWEEGDERNLGAWMPGLEPNEGEEVITKTHPSAFFGTSLTSRLRFMGIDTLVICGATTSGAVRATASDAMRENYRPMVGLSS